MITHSPPKLTPFAPARRGRMIGQYHRGDAAMDDALTEARSPGARELADLAEQLTQVLRVRTFPIGMKLLEDLDAMVAVPGVRRPTAGKKFTTCQMVTQARLAGFTLGITHDNVPGFSNCGGIIGLNEPSELY